MHSRLAELRGGNNAEVKDAAIEMMDTKEEGGAEFLPAFDKVKRKIDKIKEATDKIDALRQKTKLEVKDTEQKAIMKQLDAIMKETQAEAVQTKSLFDKILSDIKSAEEKERKLQGDDHAESGSLVIQKNLLNTHMKHFQEAMRDYQDASTKFKQSLRDRIGRQAKIINSDITEEQIDAMVASDDPGKFFREEMGLTDELLDAVAEIEERYEGMKRIEAGVREIHELFNQLAVLVELQQEHLDSIESNVEQTKNYTFKAAKEITKAEDNQKKARKCSCYLLVGLMIILVLAVAIGVPTALKLKKP